MVVTGCPGSVEGEHLGETKDGGVQTDDCWRTRCRTGEAVSVGGSDKSKGIAEP